jgi:hypothetical protein
MKNLNLKKNAWVVFLALVTLANVCLAAWPKTILDTTPALLDETGRDAILSSYGYPLPALPAEFRPTAMSGPSGVHVLFSEHSQFLDPPTIDEIGMSIMGDNFQLQVATLADGSWSISEPLETFKPDVASAALVDRYDDKVSVAHWSGNLLNIDTIDTPSNARLTLPLPAVKGKVVIDENEGVHVFVINSDYELWYHYYAGGALSQVMVSPGPVCEVTAAAGMNDQCHIAYTTFSEDSNFNQIFDEGEDLNGNEVLDETAYELVYHNIDANVDTVAEVLLENTLLPLCHFDIDWTESYGAKIAYSNPVQNAVYVAEKVTSDWSFTSVSSLPSMYQSVSVTTDISGDVAVAYVSADGQSLYYAEEDSATWTEVIVAESSHPENFSGSDLLYAPGGDPFLLTSNKVMSYLSAYSPAQLPSLFNQQVYATSIRSSFIITWPSPREESIGQILQFNPDLTDEDGWIEMERRDINNFGSENTYETVVEKYGAGMFYRVIEIVY